MAKGRKKEDKPLYRAVRFEIRRTTQEEVALLCRVSKNLRRVWNEAWRERQDRYEQFFKPIYDQIGQLKKLADEPGQKVLLRELKSAFQQHSVTLYDQINALTAKRTDAEFALIPRNWQEETLDSLDGSFKSFLALRKNGDVDAKPPRERTNENWFYKIPGRYGFKVYDDQLYLSFGALGQTLVSLIPAFQLEKIGAATRLKKFELYRDERDMTKPGRFWVSIAYEIPKPGTVAIEPKNTVYLAIGASHLGVVSPKGEFYWNLPRPDYYWKPNINALEERVAGVTKGSRKWKRLMTARARMFAKLGHQQKQHGQYEVIQKILAHGVHIVYTELQVRSKEGALADASKPARGSSPFGANWSAQNTGNIARLIQKLADKAIERGGAVIKRKPPLLSFEERQLPDDRRKILIARKLREEFLAD